MARSDFKTVADVPVGDVLLDVHNARIRAGADQNDCLRRILRKQDQLLALCEDIAKYGLGTMPILASPNEDGTYTVRDGNRRITALQLLNKPNLCPEAGLIPRINRIVATHTNFPATVDLTVTEDEEAMVREVLSRHQGEMGGVGQMGWSAYLRTLYLLNHGHPPDYKRPGQYALWAEEQGIFVDDDFPISSLQRFFTIDNLKLLGFDIDESDGLKENQPLTVVRQMATRVFGDFGGGKNVSEVFTPEQARQYIGQVRVAAGLPADAVVNDSDTTETAHEPTMAERPTASVSPASSGSSASDDAPVDSASSSSPSASPTPSSPRPVRTPAASAADRNKLFGRGSPDIAIPSHGYPKEQTVVAELRVLKLNETPLAAAMLLRALIELSDAHYRSCHSLGDQRSLAKNVRASAKHMRDRNSLTESQADIVSRVCNSDGAMIEIETLQRMVHRNTHNLGKL